MTTATPTERIALLHIPISLIDVKEQVRKKFDENAHKELVESVRSKGLINPITLRPSPRNNKRYELVAGERRYRAVVAVGYTEILSTVRDLTDEAAVLFQIDENIHRKDLTPIEESRGFKALIDAGKYTVDALAQLVDKSPAYVYRAVKLLELPVDVIAAIEDGRLTPAHGHQILRAPEGNVRDVLAASALKPRYNDELPTAKDLAERLDGADLTRATFPINKEYAGCMACTKCPYNTGNQGNLFDGAEKGGCTNKPCFDTKTETAWNDKVDTLVKLHAPTPVLVVNGYIYEGATAKGYQAKAQFTEKTKVGKNDAILVNKNGTWVGKKVAEAPAAPEVKKQTPEERALSELTATLTQEATARAIFAKVGQVPVKAWAGTVEHIVNEMYGCQQFVYQVIGGSTSKHFSNLSVPQLQVLLYLAAEVDNDGPEAIAKSLKIDLKRLQKEAAATAAIQLKNRPAGK